MLLTSATIITFNEEKKIARCLRSVAALVDEIVVVDSFSTDRTQEICCASEFAHKMKFIQHPFAGHIQQKNYALEIATHPHILSLDADECLDEELQKEILKALQNWQGDGYIFNRLTNYNGHWVRHCGWYPDKKLRLWDRRKGRWGGVNPHDIVEMQEGTRCTHLAGNILHYSYDSIADHMQQTNSFTSISARALHSKGVQSNILKITLRPIWQFFRDYILLSGFRDGLYGFVICSINAMSVFLKYAKLWDLTRHKNGP